MSFRNRSLSARARLTLTVVASVAGSLLMTGCGLGGSPATTTSAVTSTASFTGILHGGPNPVQGAIVKLFITGSGGLTGANGGYGVGTFVQEANPITGGAGGDSGTDGSFSFAGGYPCPAGQFLYIVSAGGFTGGNDPNPKAFLVSALGRCEDLFDTNGTYTGGFIYLNELSTVAAAYALGNFTNVTGTGLSAVIGIGAPDANNASLGCVANGSTCPTTVAAGLRHGFENAANLINPFQSFANSTLPGNNTARVPLQLINTIANIMVACVNSDGTSTACQLLFNATGTDFTNGNTFEAAVNLAKNPTLAGSGVTSAQLLAASTPQTNFYQPFLTSAPPDYSISINYPKLTGQVAGTTQGLTYPFSGTLDINDNYYIGNYDSASKVLSNAASFTSNGTLVSFTPDNATNISGNAASIDLAGNLYLFGNTPSNATTPGTISRYAINSATGAISPTPTTLLAGNAEIAAGAVDRIGNLWFSLSGSNLAEVLVNDTSVTFMRGAGGPVSVVAVDPNQNIWSAVSSNSGTNAVNTQQNMGTVAAPSYTGTGTLKTFLFQGSFTSGISFISGSPYTAYVSNLIASAGITKFVPTVTGNEVTAVSNSGQISTGANTPTSNQSDGAGIIWAANGNSVAKFTPGAASIVNLNPCTVSTFVSNVSCTASPYSAVQSISIDSAGSVWFLSSATGTVNQLIGAAAPTWPLLSLGQLGEPQ
jgi:hypothetical protein